MAIDSAYKTIQHAASLQDQNLEVAQDGVEQSRFGRPSSRTVGTEKDVKYEARPKGSKHSLRCDQTRTD